MPVMAAYVIGIIRIRSVVTVATYFRVSSSPKITRYTCNANPSEMVSMAAWRKK